MCFRLSIDANLLAMSRLGAWWLLRTEHRRKIALKHSKISVEYRMAGPKRGMSSTRFGKIWSFILLMIFNRSINPKASKTLPIRISRSLYKKNNICKIKGLYKIWEHTHQIAAHILDFWNPEKGSQRPDCLDECKLIRTHNVMHVEDHCLHEGLKMLPDETIAILHHIGCANWRYR